MNSKNSTQEKFVLSFCGGAGSVTGSNFLLQGAGRSILVDCGLFQGGEIAREKNNVPFPYLATSIDVLFITHAHLDHIGRIPKLFREGFRGMVYSTQETKEIAGLMFTDTANVYARNPAEENADPGFTLEDIERIMGAWRTVPYNTDIPLGGGLTATLRNSGHILGSAMVEISRGGRKIVFTGDLGNPLSPLLPESERISGSAYIVMESVYGDRNHDMSEARSEKLRRVIADVAQKNGVLMIPAFSIERTQELLFELNMLAERGDIPEIPVFLDSPLAIRVTDIYKRSTHLFKKETRDIIAGGDDIFKFPRLKFTLHSDDSRAIAHAPFPKIIIAGSGMSEGGRITHHESLYLPDARNTLLIVGYQAPGTLGRMIQDGAKTVSINGRDVAVRANIITIEGYSGHIGSDGLLEFLHDAREGLEKVFLVQGELKSSLFLAQRARDYFDIPAVVPEEGQRVDIML